MSLILRTHVKMPGRVVHTCSPISVKIETEESLSLSIWVSPTDHTSLLSKSQANERPFFKEQGASGMTPEGVKASTHVNKYLHT